MGRSEIIKRLAEKMYGNATPEEIRDCTIFCDNLVEIIKEALVDGEKVSWHGFMSLEVVDKPAVKRRHPQTNKIVTFPAKKSIKCKLSRLIKNAVNEDDE